MSRASSSSSRSMTSVSYLVLAVFVLLLVLMIKSYALFVRTPSRVRAVLEDASRAVDPEAPLALQRTQFLDKMEISATAKSCPEAVRSCDSSSFVEDRFVILYTDSIEFPGLPTYRHGFRIETPLILPREAP